MHADENWLEKEGNHIQGRRNSLNMLLLRSTNSMSACESVTAANLHASTNCFSESPSSTKGRRATAVRNMLHAVSIAPTTAILGINCGGSAERKSLVDHKIATNMLLTVHSFDFHVHVCDISNHSKRSPEMLDFIVSTRDEFGAAFSFVAPEALPGPHVSYPGE